MPRMTASPSCPAIRSRYPSTACIAAWIRFSGIFNPTLLYLNYSAEEEESKGQLTQYGQMDRASPVTVEMPTDITFPEGSDKTTVMVTDGYISGGMYSRRQPFDTLYNMTDTGVGTNFSAVTTSFVASRLARCFRRGQPERSPTSSSSPWTKTATRSTASPPFSTVTTRQ